MGVYSDAIVVSPDRILVELGAKPVHAQVYLTVAETKEFRRALKAALDAHKEDWS